MVRKLFEEFLSEADNGCVFDGEFYYNIHIHTNYQGDFVPVLRINDFKRFYEELEDYFKYAPLDKRNMAYLFINMTTEDFNDPIDYVRRNKNFIKNKLFGDKTISNIESLFNCDINTYVKNYGLETPYSFNVDITDGVEVYNLPLISYGISDDICYIYAVVDKNEPKDTTFYKKIKRKLYSLNKHVLESESDEYLEYKSGSSYYPENISDVSPSAILSLTIFLNELETLGINKVRIVPYLPIRYNAKEMSIIRKANYLAKKDKSKTKDKLLLELELEQLRIQNNLTQKFLRNFNRLIYHFDNIDIISYPYDMDEFMHLSISEFFICENELLNEIVNTCENKRILIK